MALKDNLIAVYEMNETSGTTCNDSHSNAYHGTINGSVSINQTGKLDKAYSYPNSVSANVSLPSGTKITGSTDRTFTAWIKPNSLNSENFVVGMGDSGTTRAAFEFEYTQTGKLAIVGWGHDPVTTATMVSTGSWQFIYCRLSSGTLYLGYIASGTVTEESFSFAAVTGGTNSPGIGRNSYTTTGAIDGLIDQVAIWNRALSVSELQTIENNGSGLAYSSWDAVTGPAKLKTLDTVAKSSIKTVSGIAIANVKTINTIGS